MMSSQVVSFIIISTKGKLNWFRHRDWKNVNNWWSIRWSNRDNRLTQNISMMYWITREVLHSLERMHNCTYYYYDSHLIATFSGEPGPPPVVLEENLWDQRNGFSYGQDVLPATQPRSISVKAVKGSQRMHVWN